MKYLSKSMILTAIQNAASKNTKYYNIILTLAKTGCRVSELNKITPQDILFEEKQIILKGKGKKIRNIDVPSDLLLQLKLYIKTNKIRNNKSLFPLTRQRITQISKEFSGLSAHAFRHSYAIHLLRTTKNIRYVQKQLGHSSLAVTEIYLQFLEYDQEKNKLGELYA
jgi:integrase/recombinase XerC/integrase/recombinase XerD